MSKKKGVILSLSIILVVSALYYLGTNETPNQNSQTGKLAFEDTGDFKVVYGKTKNPKYTEYNELLKKAHIFENFTVFLNNVLILKQDFPIIIQQCDTANAFYSLKDKHIVICDELLESLFQNFSYIVSPGEELNNAVSGATFFIMYHELGHGLIDIYNLPYSGKEEDVADQLASVVLTGMGEDGPKVAITGANYFYITSPQVGEESPFWDEHSLNKQRYYNILCWVYGSNPQKFNYFVGTYGLPEERAARCEYEYKKMFEFWNTALTPYVKAQIKPETNK
ncbi:MAG: hypothetical protein UV36_C0007G0004 [Parcubacteria group bacterium GW2011_GWC2_42_6]|nr:MAG: hypothetical protein UV36_C0007G0004 [Parcubacteria group bacterium GW2011_GWC2_42_6]